MLEVKVFCFIVSVIASPFSKLIWDVQLKNVCKILNSIIASIIVTTKHGSQTGGQMDKTKSALI